MIMKKFLVTFCLLVATFSLSAQSFKTTILFDKQILDKNGYLSMNFYNNGPNTKEYFVTIENDGSVDVGGVGVPAVSYTVSDIGHVIQIVINNLSEDTYSFAGQVYWNGPNQYNVEWYCNDIRFEPGSFTYPIYRNTTIQIKL